MTEPSKFQIRMASLEGQAATTWQVAGPETLAILADAERALKRAASRADNVAEEWERREIKPQRGAPIEFWGKLLASDQWETRGRDPMRVEFELWQTRGGALVAVSASEPTDREGVEVVRATVVEAQDDAQAMRLAVMDQFEWHDRARSMARKLGWSLRREVE